jgi:hypothetical protein
MDQQVLGRTILIIGGILLVIGLIVYFQGDKLHFIGRLPGDIKIERGNVKLYFPITTMILLSALITAIMRLFQYLR